MGFSQAVKSCFNQYVGFTGRAPRSEFWWFQLFIIISYVVIAIIGIGLLGEAGGALVGIFALAMFLPSIAVVVRRLHDIDRSGWWYFITFVPLVGPFVLLYFMVKRGDQGPNSFGNDPLAG